MKNIVILEALLQRSCGQSGVFTLSYKSSSQQFSNVDLSGTGPDGASFSQISPGEHTRMNPCETLQLRSLEACLVRPSFPRSRFMLGGLLI